MRTARTSSECVYVYVRAMYWMESHEKSFNRKIAFRKIVFCSFTIWLDVSFVFHQYPPPLSFVLFKEIPRVFAVFVVVFSIFDWFPFIYSPDEIIIAHYSTFFFIIIIDLQIIAFTFLSFNRKIHTHTHACSANTYNVIKRKELIQ